MSEIMIVKDTIEVKTVVVPDYQPTIDVLQALDNVKTQAEDESQKTVDMLSDSILEQIATYLFEMLKPVIQYFNQEKIDIRPDLKWVDSSWALERRQEYGHPRFDSMQLRYSGRGKYFFIKFDTAGYHIYTQDLDKEILSSLVKCWPAFKTFTQQRIKVVLDAIAEQTEQNIRYNQNVIETLNSFEL